MAAIRHEPVDRVPLSYWAAWNVRNRDGLVEKYGDMDAALDALDIDTRTAMLPTLRVPLKRGQRVNSAKEALALPAIDDPLDPERYETPRPLFEAKWKGVDPNQHGFSYALSEAVEKFKGKKAVLCHLWGPTEICHQYFGIEGLLMQSAADPEGLKRLLMMAGEFSARCAEKAAEYGPDIFQISDDWGMNERLMFRPEFWWDAIRPAIKQVADVCHSLGVPVILHSDGDIMEVMDGILEMDFCMLHPVQSSAGMDQLDVKRRYGEKIGIYGGLDITHTLPFGTLEEIDEEIAYVMDKLGEGSGYMFSPAHMVPPEVPTERTEYFYERAAIHAVRK